MQGKTSAISDLFHKVFLENITAKLMALAMAVALWLYAYHFSIARDRAYRLPLTAVPPTGWAVDVVRPKMVDVTLDFPQRFERDLQQAYDNNELRIIMNVSPEEGGPDRQTRAIALKLSPHLATPRSFGIRKAQFEPPVAQVELVRQDVKELAVELDYSPPPDGWQVSGEPTVNPARVEVKGRKDILEEVNAIETERVDISRTLPVTVADWPYEFSVGTKDYVTLNGTEYPVECNEEVTVSIKLERVPEKRTFTGVPVRLLALSPDYPYEIEMVGEARRDVEVSGPRNVVEKLTPGNIVLYVQPGNREPNEVPYTLPIETDFVDTQGESTLSVKLSRPPTMQVKISERTE